MTDMKANSLRSSVQDARLASPAPENGVATPGHSDRKMQYNFGRMENQKMVPGTPNAFGSRIASPRYGVEAASNEGGSKPRTALTSQG
jgi:hypothetical protein